MSESMEIEEPIPRKMRITITEEVCVSDNSVIMLLPKKNTPDEILKQMRVQTPWGVELRPLRYMKLEMRKGFPEEYRYVDVVTGTIYHPDTGHCNTTQLRMLGEA